MYLLVPFDPWLIAAAVYVGWVCLARWLAGMEPL
jgi:hypothetical protein